MSDLMADKESPWIEDDEDGYSPDDDEDEQDPWECCFPDKCLMQGEHRQSECYTVEDAEEYDRHMAAEHGGLSVSIHSDAPFEEWPEAQKAAFAEMVQKAMEWIRSKA